MNLINIVYKEIMMTILLLIGIYINIFVFMKVYDINNIKHKYNTINITNKNKYSDIYLCKLFDCKAIKNNNKLTIFDEFIPIEQIEYNYNSLFYFFNSNLGWDMNVNTAILKLKENKIVFLDLKDDIHKDIYIMIFTLPTIIVLFILLLIKILKNERNYQIQYNAGIEALSMNNSMIMITENIHHELNTPLEVIDNKIEKISRLLHTFIYDNYECWLSDNTMSKNDVSFETYILEKEQHIFLKKLYKLERDFNFIRFSSEQIYNILEKMKGFKHLRYSNGNKSVYDIISGAFKMISISNTNFTFEIDDKFKLYRLESKKIKNADLLNIIINHIKNSLEANASKILIKFNHIEHNYLFFRFIDNGHGIQIKNQQKIFDSDFSTKTDTSIPMVRGNGMYLNKHLIQMSGGDIKLISSSQTGTTLELKIPIIALQEVTPNG